MFDMAHDLHKACAGKGKKIAIDMNTLNYLPYLLEIVMLVRGMSYTMKIRRYSKLFCLLFTSLLFLGEIEVSTSASSPDSQFSIHNDRFSQTIISTEALFSENSEERDVETGADSYVVTENVNLPSTVFTKTFIIPDTLFLPSGRNPLPVNSRAPPAI
jgi:hypothetical protein